ncbi:hypothetical protein DNTS_029949 [Danionella cerebrum]|uniref:Ig-like domain-containing protein n=1 Tax=Danionella cerebrum TaxID=2873325 RepID=A0A553RQ05_9TELE|nr:hypothetical protein DNTS_029949 [Danionella translucida]
MILFLTSSICSLLSVSFGSFIIPIHREVYKKEGQDVTLSCNYSSAVTLLWYRQFPGSVPEFLMILLHSTGQTHQKSDVMNKDPRLSGRVNEEKTQVDLKISSAAVSDSAVYHCALQPTVTGNMKALYKNLHSTFIGLLPALFTQADTITPDQTEVLVDETERISLSCQYSSAYSLLWYRQHQASPPQFLMLILQSTGTVVLSSDERLSGKLNPEKTRLHLEIPSSMIEDSAMYYCALQPTLTRCLSVETEESVSKMLLITCFLLGVIRTVRSESLITPEQTEMFHKEGANLTLSCSYSFAITLHWYRKSPGSAPEFLLLVLQASGRVQSAQNLDPRFTAMLNDKKNSVNLIISAAKLTDSALYYCALEPTVRGRASFEDSVTPISPVVYANDKQNVIISCEYQYTVSMNNLQWYRQYPNSKPEFLVLILESGETLPASPPHPRVNASVDKENKLMNLEIQAVDVKDSALYYCALQPTVTGNTSTAYKNLLAAGRVCKRSTRGHPISAES